MSKTPSTAQTTFQDGIDSLWRFQLRREHRELLQCQEQQLKLIQTIREEHSNLRKEVEERCSTLEARMLEFEEAEKKDQQAFERHDEEMRILRAEFGVEIEKQERQLSEGYNPCSSPGALFVDSSSSSW
jgi:sulfite reductase alpha subunit-like flavoprotein